MPPPHGNPEPATVVCVIGMPRTGTSLTIRMLNLAGVYLGPESEMVPPGKRNPNGFWEIRRMDALNRRILKSLGGDGILPPDLPSDAAVSETLEAERAEARELLAEIFTGHRRWGLKVTALLPFWQQLLPPMRYVICVRNPVDIAASLEASTGTPRSQVLAAWPRHMAAAFAHTTGSPRILISYDDYIEAPRETIERLWHFAGNEEAPTDAELDRLAGSLDQDLMHHRTSHLETLRDESVPLETASMYTLTELLRRTTTTSVGRVTTAELEAAIDAHSRRVMQD